MQKLSIFLFLALIGCGSTDTKSTNSEIDILDNAVAMENTGNNQVTDKIGKRITNAEEGYSFLVPEG